MIRWIPMGPKDMQYVVCCAFCGQLFAGLPSFRQKHEAICSENDRAASEIQIEDQRARVDYPGPPVDPGRRDDGIRSEANVAPRSGNGRV